MNRPLAAKHMLLNRLHDLRRILDDTENDVQADDLIDPDVFLEALADVVDAGATWNTAVIARAAG